MKKVVMWIVVFLALIGVVFYFSSRGTSGKTNRELALDCTTDALTKFHIHPFLKIIINGTEFQIPLDIGIKSNCMNPLHTHEESGKIHIESPEPRDFTLSDFFAVWEKTFSKDQILDYKADENNTIRMTVNGRESNEFENLVLRDASQIVIYYETRNASSLPNN